MAASDSKIDPVAVPAHVLSMTDEEGDILDFQAYLQTLPPDSLWDILAHIDSEKYPLRVQAAQREIARRRLFFVSPYTRLEARLRNVYGATVGVSALAAALRLVANVDIPLEPSEHLTWFFDIAVGGPPAARMVLPLVCLLAEVGAICALAGVLIGGWYFLRRRLRSDVFAMGPVALVIVFALLRIASNRQP